MSTLGNLLTTLLMIVYLGKTKLVSCVTEIFIVIDGFSLASNETFAAA